MAKKSILTKKSLSFLENYINNPSPTGFESEGQKIWLKYLKPYIDDYIVDTYGTVVGIINPQKNTALLLKHMRMKFLGLYIILLMMVLSI